MKFTPKDKKFRLYNCENLAAILCPDLESHFARETLDTKETLNQLMSAPAHTGSADSPLVASLCQVQSGNYVNFDSSHSYQVDDVKKSKTLRQKAAFTLAEVLITIGIIGIVAAITLPALHKKITKTVLKNQIKKTMSLVAQNYRKTVDDLGEPMCSNSDAKPSSNCLDFNNTFINNFKIARICNGNGLQDKCVPEYEGLNLSDCAYFKDSYVYNTDTIYVTLDGLIFIPYKSSIRSLWLVDVNGMKGPNKAGWDLFEFSTDPIDKVTNRNPRWVSASCINQPANRVKGSIVSTDMSFKTVADW
jgi:prepilin-type N-terminal cleavage/methylation domain-containing protein